MLLVCLLAIAPAQAAENVLTQAEIADGWIQLFDGETLFGWTAETKADWKVADGAIVVTSGEQGLLRTNAEFADYVLKADFRAPKETNSGIFLRTSPKPANPKEGCYELNIADPSATPFPTGSLVARKKAEVDYDRAAWHGYEVTCKGAKITVKLDGKEVLDYTDDKPTLRGYIGLQINLGKVEFKNVKLKPLALESIYNGKDLTGWTTPKDQKAEITVERGGVLRVGGGKGQLESLAKYADFTLQMEAMSNRKASNSGLFFRSIPGQMMNGYECQLQNAYGKDGKPNLVDCGTGGICRRQTARKLVAKDQKWFHLTLIATGDHVAAWVNGYAVSDFTDTRKPHENPRQGQRLEAGTLILQVHDETTDFSFRNLAAVEMPKR